MLPSAFVPFVCKLFPLQPGYVMTVWAAAREVQHSAATQAFKVQVLDMASGAAATATLKASEGRLGGKLELRD